MSIRIKAQMFMESKNDTLVSTEEEEKSFCIGMNIYGQYFSTACSHCINDKQH